MEQIKNKKLCVKLDQALDSDTSLSGDIKALIYTAKPECQSEGVNKATENNIGDLGRDPKKPSQITTE